MVDENIFQCTMFYKASMLCIAVIDYKEEEEEHEQSCKNHTHWTRFSVEVISFMPIVTMMLICVEVD